MRLFGLEITRAKAAPTARLQSVSGSGWWPIIREPRTNAWQRNEVWSAETVAAHHAVFSCITLIANDVGKLRPKLVEYIPSEGIWEETQSPAFSPVLRKPNRYQNHIQFKESWIHSKLQRGNTYVLKVRDARGVVVRLYLLDPSRVTVLVAPDGSVFYQLGGDNLSGLEGARTVPASEIIHDRVNCLFHPLVGVSPIFASGMAATVGLRIEENASGFFENGSNPGGVLTAPKTIAPETAERLKEHWENEYTGENAGKIAVLGDGLTFEPMRMSAVDAQMIEHLKWTAETVCSTFHVPPFKLGIGAMPAYNNAELLNQIYYSDCLQSHIEQYEACMDEGLGLTEPKDGKVLGVELDLDALLRMDQATMMDTLGKGVGAGILSPNEARRKVDQRKVKGGNTPYLQQQNFSLSALDERDRNNPAPSPSGASASPSPTPAAPPQKQMSLEESGAYARLRVKQRRIAA